MLTVLCLKRTNWSRSASSRSALQCSTFLLSTSNTANESMLHSNCLKVNESSDWIWKLARDRSLFALLTVSFSRDNYFLQFCAEKYVSMGIRLFQATWAVYTSATIPLIFWESQPIVRSVSFCSTSEADNRFANSHRDQPIIIGRIQVKLSCNGFKMMGPFEGTPMEIDFAHMLPLQDDIKRLLRFEGRNLSCYEVVK